MSNMATAYSLMVCEARGAILNPGAEISKAGAQFTYYSNVTVHGSKRNSVDRGGSDEPGLN